MRLKPAASKIYLPSFILFSALGYVSFLVTFNKCISNFWKQEEFTKNCSVFSLLNCRHKQLKLSQLVYIQAG